MQYGIVLIVALLLAAVVNLWISEDPNRPDRARRRRRAIAGLFILLALLVGVWIYLLPVLGPGPATG